MRAADLGASVLLGQKLSQIYKSDTSNGNWGEGGGGTISFCQTMQTARKVLGHQVMARPLAGLEAVCPRPGKMLVAAEALSVSRIATIEQ